MERAGTIWRYTRFLQNMLSMYLFLTLRKVILLHFLFSTEFWKTDVPSQRIVDAFYYRNKSVGDIISACTEHSKHYNEY